MQNVDYRYNIRGWLTDINDVNNILPNGDLFAFKINYNEIEMSTSVITPLYNGNIAETHWRSAYDHLKRGYAYKYDNLNRLKEAHYLRGGFFNNSYNEFLNYDKNGNITSLYRTGMVEDGSNPMVIDQLTYAYANNGLSNKLMKVTDAPGANRDYGFKDDSDGTNDIEDDYTYDTYGNMTSDQNKGILLIDYNHLNLPIRIRFNNGYQIEYLYNAAGVKLAKTVIEQATTTTVYMDGYQYIEDKLQFFPQAEGYVKFTEGNNNQEFFNYIYQYKDHLGNNRMSYTIDPSDNVLKILTEDHYYPFGMKHQGYSNFVSDVRPPPGLATLMVMDVNDLAYKYKYNGKELQDELGLDWYDYEARNYDPAIGRWMNIDPLAETSRRWSPYTYAYNNPLRFIDPDGMQNFDVIITGSEMKKAFEQLQQSTQGQLNLSMDEGGKVTATAVEGVQLTEASQTFLNATEDSNVTVNLNATSDNIQADGTIIVGGVFEGSKMVDGVVEAYQTVNPNQMEVIDGVTQRGEGVGTLHEVLEAYVGAKNSNGKNTTKGSRKEKAYEAAHTEAKRIDPRHNELTGTSPHRPPYFLKNGNGTYDVNFQVEYKGTRVPLFSEKNAKLKKR